MLGTGTVLPLSYYHPDLPWSIKVQNTYDQQAAKTLLDQVGLKDSDGDGIREFGGKPMQYEMLCDSNNSVEIRSTELIAGWLKEVGVTVTPKCMDIDTEVTFIWPNFVAVPAPDYDLAIFGWSSGPQVQRGFIQFLTNADFGGLGWANLTGTFDPQLDQLIADLVSNPDPTQQQALNQQVQERFAEVSCSISP
jgi:peptide/nickel transport system substrate-binding protein